MAQWIRRLPTEQEIPGSSPGMGCFDLIVFLCCKTNKKLSAQPESNQRPRDINCKQLQSPALPTELYADLVKNRFYRDLNPDYKDQNLGC